MQCCGSITFWCGSGSGSADSCLRQMDPGSDPDPVIFVIDLQDAIKTKYFIKNFMLISLLLKVHLHHFAKIKRQKEVTKQKYQGFSYSFCLMIEGSRAGSIHLTNDPDPDPGGPKTYLSDGSGSATLLSWLTLFLWWRSHCSRWQTASRSRDLYHMSENTFRYCTYPPCLLSLKYTVVPDVQSKEV
jgi:hypothetical protein